MSLRFIPVLKMRNIRSLVPLIATGEQLNPSNSSTNPSAVVNMSGAGIAPTTLSALSCSSASYNAAGTDACTVTLSGAPLAAPSGVMVGTYSMQRVDDGHAFDIAVPAFPLDSPYVSRQAN